MSIRNSLQEIAAAWPEYIAGHGVDKKAAVYQLVTDTLPSALRQAIGLDSRLRVVGSTGRGNVTAAPWIAIFDPRLTTTATTGYYVVYLFSVDLTTVTLCIAFDTTQFEGQFGGPTAAFPRMRDAANRLQDLYQRFAPARYSRDSIHLGATRDQKLHFAYEQASIFSLPPYRLDNLPADAQLISDLSEIVGVYTSIVEDPLKPEIDILIQSAIPVLERPRQINAVDFVPRPPAASRSNAKASKKVRRYSPESRKVGDAGERAVMEYEREKLEKCGRSELSAGIRHHAAEGEFPGWDITSFDEAGHEIFIEVKASIGSTVAAVDVTSNEWAAATRKDIRNQYFIYVVTDALSDRPTIEKMRNPHAYVSHDELVLEPLVYQLALRQRRG